MRPPLNGEAEERQAIIVAMNEAGYKQTDDTELIRQGKKLLAAHDMVSRNVKHYGILQGRRISRSPERCNFLSTAARPPAKAELYLLTAVGLMGVRPQLAVRHSEISCHHCTNQGKGVAD